MSLSDLSVITISLDAAGLNQVGFGTALIVHNHTFWAETVKAFDIDTVLSELTNASVPTHNPIYKAAQAIAAQYPRPSRLKVGKCTAKQQVLQFTPVASQSAYSVTIEYLGTEYTAESAAGTAKQIVEALVSDFGSISGLTIAEDDSVMTITTASGTVVYFIEATNLDAEDISQDPGIAADMDAIRLYDDDWYGFVLGVNDRDTCEEAADWAETQTKMYVCQTFDWQAADSGETDDIGYVLKAKSYARTVSMYHARSDEFACAALLGDRFPAAPGSDTWAFKTLGGVTKDTITPSQKTNLRAKNYMVYIDISGIGMTLDGKTASGEYADVTRFIDWLRIRMQERIVLLQASNPKIAYTDTGVSQIMAEISAQLAEGVGVGGLSDDPAPVVTAPLVENVSSSDKLARTLNNVKFSGTLAGAIHLANISGSISA